MGGSTTLKKGFERLKGAAVAGAMGLGMAAGGLGAAVTSPTRSLPFSHRGGSVSDSQVGSIAWNFSGIAGSEAEGAYAFQINDAAITTYVSTGYTTYSSAYWTYDFYTGDVDSGVTYVFYTVSQPSTFWTSDSNFITSSTYSERWSYTQSYRTLDTSASPSNCPISNPPSNIPGLTGAASNFQYSQVTNHTVFHSYMNSPTAEGGAIRDCYNVYEYFFSSWSTHSYFTSYFTPSVFYSETGGYTDAFDGALWLEVDGEIFQNPDSTVDFSDNTLASDVMEDIVDGIDAQIEYYFHPDKPLVRARYLLTNTTTSDIDAEVVIGGNLGSDRNTQVEGSSDGNKKVNAGDLWHVSSDEAEGGDIRRGGSDPVITITRFGPNAPVIPSIIEKIGVEDAEGGFSEDFVNQYDVTVPAGETIAVMVFVEMNIEIDDALNGAKKYNSLAAMAKADTDLLYGLGESDLEQLVNYNVKNEAENALDEEKEELKKAKDDDDDGLFGSLNIAYLIMMMCYGFISVVRRK